MQDQMELLLKASESLSELYSHDFYPPPPPMNTALPTMPTECKHSSHKWELKTFQLLFSREIERSEWNHERQVLIKENQMLLNQLLEAKALLVRSIQSVSRVQNSHIMDSMHQRFDQLLSKCDKLEYGIHYNLNYRN